ncbi:response regulator [Eleftheria terrae]|uniref:response regulator n=1 Tax=Eleftheria terrae TaxID=1597781 RepID=UPI00263A89A8|nr:response regulator [Eleftheria terrae]WKB51678.1 response regulator [Eleftheria terrae]
MYRSGMPYLLCEELTEALRRRVPEAHGKGLRCFFSYEGVLPVARGPASIVHDIADRLLANAIANTFAGAIFFAAEVRSISVDLCRITLTVSDTGIGRSADPPAAPDAPDAGASLPAADVPTAAMSAEGHLGVARSLLEAVAGSIEVHDHPGQGSVILADWTVPCLAPIHEVTQNLAGGAQAWLVGRLPETYELLSRNLQRLGWSIRTLSSCEEAHALLAGRPPKACPALVIGTEEFGVELAALAGLRNVLPTSTRLVLQVHATSGTTWQARWPDVEVCIAPLSPAQLVHMTYIARHGAEEPRPHSDTQPAALTFASRPCVLVVDDNPVNRELAVQMLQVLGFEAEAVDDGLQAITACAHHPPFAVLMDVQMPRMDGLEACRRIRSLQADGTLARFPIIAATTQSSQLDRTACEAAGMDGFITKPLDLRSMGEEIRRVVHYGAALG